MCYTNFSVGFAINTSKQYVCFVLTIFYTTDIKMLILSRTQTVVYDRPQFAVVYN